MSSRSQRCCCGYSICLLYWYKSANTDADMLLQDKEEETDAARKEVEQCENVLSLLALLVQKYEY